MHVQEAQHWVLSRLWKLPGSGCTNTLQMPCGDDDRRWWYCVGPTYKCNSLDCFDSNMCLTMYTMWFSVRSCSMFIYRLSDVELWRVEKTARSLMFCWFREFWNVSTIKKKLNRHQLWFILCRGLFNVYRYVNALLLFRQKRCIICTGSSFKQPRERRMYSENYILSSIILWRFSQFSPQRIPF